MKNGVKVLLLLSVLLIGFRAILPGFLLGKLNHTLEEELGLYSGQVGDLDLSIYRGAYQLQNIEVRKKGISSKEKPILKIHELDLSISWTALFHRKIAIDLVVKKPELFLADSRDSSRAQLAKDEPAENWKSAFDLIVPIQLQTLEIKKGKLEFIHRDIRQMEPIILSNIKFLLEKIQTHEREKLSPFSASGILQRHANLKIGGKINFLSKEPVTDINYVLEGFNLTKVNKVLLEYIPLDITRGELDLYGEFISKNGSAQGYVKAFVKDGDVIAPKQKFKGVKHVFYEVLTGFTNWLLKNVDTKNFAIRIPFRRSSGSWEVDGEKAFWSSVNNLSKEMSPTIENQLKL